jgi:hypothetical protein
MSMNKIKEIEHPSRWSGGVCSLNRTFDIGVFPVRIARNFGPNQPDADERAPLMIQGLTRPRVSLCFCS